jgi:rsbT antagonist protein RsbS
MRIPILRLNSRVLIVALGADITDESVMDFQGELAERTAALQARGVVIDVSALDLVDSFMARVLSDSARMLRLLGAEVVVCGVKPAVAMTLVEMGVTLGGVPTSFTLERGLARLDELMALAERAGAAGTDPAAPDHA